MVEYVHMFPGHIPCDENLRSEIVIPVHCKGRVIGVLDIDSPSLGRFTEEERVGLDKLVRIFEKSL